MEYPHVQAAFINAIREEGTKKEACDWLQKQWNETCYLRDQLKEADKHAMKLEALRAALKPFTDFVFAPNIEDSDTFILRLGNVNPDSEYAGIVPTISAGDLRRAAEAYAALEAASTDGEGWARGLEAAAKLCDAEAPGWHEVTGNPCERLAKRIRALSPAPASKGPTEASRVENARREAIEDVITIMLNATFTKTHAETLEAIRNLIPGEKP